ncbi:MAG: beta-N-acetylhexosaminidase [Lachnospiraceae bacterium]|nr:beta-N-acetylhexosaminidase [Lachnospiraceae bacterium]
MADNTEVKQDKQQQEQEAAEKREERRRRRRRNQLLAYLAVLLFILVVVGGVIMAVVALSGQKGNEQQNDTPYTGDIESILGEEETLVKPEETEHITEPTPEQRLDDIIDAAIEVMPLEDKVAGLFIVTPEAITGVNRAVQAGEGTKDALNQYAVGGIIYFKQNIQSEEQLTEMLSNTALFSRYPLFLAVDEEGGSVSRVAEAGLAENVGSAKDIGATGDTNNAYAAGKSMADYLVPLGFNLDFAPVADIDNMENSFIGDRSYGSSSELAAAMVASMTAGLQENGVSACLKHFPGIGCSVEDTHIGMAVTERTAEQFRAEEFTVFAAGIEAGADFVMMGHISAPALTGDNTPCTLSEIVVTDILRNELHFNGVIITDAMNMGAITEYYEADEAAILALRAGCDMILMPDDFELAYNGVLEAVRNGTISEERINDSLRRIYRIKEADKLPE